MVKKICIALAAIVLCATSAAAADGEWFVSSDKTFTKLIADGFEIVGFTGQARMTGFSEIYVLQRDGEVYRCSRTESPAVQSGKWIGQCAKATD